MCGMCEGKKKKKKKKKAALDRDQRGNLLSGENPGLDDSYGTLPTLGIL